MKFDEMWWNWEDDQLRLPRLYGSTKLQHFFHVIWRLSFAHASNCMYTWRCRNACVHVALFDSAIQNRPTSSGLEVPFECLLSLCWSSHRIESKCASLGPVFQICSFMISLWFPLWKSYDSSEGLLVCERCIKIHDFGYDVGYDWETLVVVLLKFFQYSLQSSCRRLQQTTKDHRKLTKAKENAKVFPLLGFPKAHLQTFC